MPARLHPATATSAATAIEHQQGSALSPRARHLGSLVPPGARLLMCLLLQVVDSSTSINSNNDVTVFQTKVKPFLANLTSQIQALAGVFWAEKG